MIVCPLFYGSTWGSKTVMIRKGMMLCFLGNFWSVDRTVWDFGNLEYVCSGFGIHRGLVLFFYFFWVGRSRIDEN